MRNPVVNIGKICFKRWTRKKFSILLSLSRVVKIGVLCLAYSLVNKPQVCAQPNDSVMLNSKEIPEVEVTGRRSQVVSSASTRMVSVIQHDEIEKAGIQNLVDLLEYASNVDVRQRGTYGIQADVTIRGSSFDHVMVLINGIALTDPQTGHFSLDIPIDFESVEKVEILEGSAARALGPGAFMGAINIITHLSGKNELGASQTIGQYGYLRSNLNGGIRVKAFSNNISASFASSDGYAKNTDFRLANFFYRLHFDQGQTSADFQTGYQTKKFGAAGFYTPVYPDQYEETAMWFGSLKVVTGNVLKISPVIYWRHKDDYFLPNRENPSFYPNYHLTNVYGSQLNLTCDFGKIAATLGFDLKSEGIFSNRMGYEYANPRPIKDSDSLYYTRQYNRTNFATFIEFVLRLGHLKITGGSMVNWNTGFKEGASVFPGIDVSYQMGKNSVFFSVNRALHLPTFTDLFYTDPFNQGNVGLKPNRMVSYECGLLLNESFATIRLSGFYNNGHDIVDWLWSYRINKFSPVNTSNYTSDGFTLNIRKTIGVPFISSISVNYLLLDTKKSMADSVSKYNNLKNKLSLMINQQWTRKIGMAWNISYQDRKGATMGYHEQSKAYFAVAYKPYWLVDWSIQYYFTHFRLFAEITNLLNTHYIDAGFAPQPGRWFKAGLMFSFAQGKQQM